MAWVDTCCRNDFVQVIVGGETRRPSSQAICKNLCSWFWMVSKHRKVNGGDMNIFKKTGILAGLLMMFGSTALAVAPSNSVITNTAKLTYTGNTAGIFASVDVSVSLAPSASTLASPAGLAPADNTVAVNQVSSVDYLLTATSNGVDTYLVSGVSTPTGLTGTSATVVYKQGVATVTSVTLGATAALVQAIAGATTITVPSDGVADSNLNGIQNGDEVVIAGTAYLVNVTDVAPGNSTLTLIAGTLSDGTAAPTTLQANVPTGTLIAEQQVVTMEIADVGVISGATPQVSVVTTVMSNTDNTKVSTDTHVTLVVAVVFEKYVRNTTGANPAAAGTLINGVTYYATADAVSAVSGDILEYAIRVTTDPAAGIAGAVITDAVPPFTSYVASSTLLNAKTVAGDGATSPLGAGLTIDDDNPVRAAGAAASGNMAAGTTAVITFQVTVD